MSSQGEKPNIKTLKTVYIPVFGSGVSSLFYHSSRGVYGSTKVEEEVRD